MHKGGGAEKRTAGGGECTILMHKHTGHTERSSYRGGAHLQKQILYLCTPNQVGNKNK